MGRGLQLAGFAHQGGAKNNVSASIYLYIVLIFISMPDFSKLPLEEGNPAFNGQRSGYSWSLIKR